MPQTQGRSGKGTTLFVGDGGLGAAVAASKTIGTVNQQLKVVALVPGTSGNSKTFGIIVAGNSTAYSQVITPTSVLINSATDSGGVATTTPLQAIANLYADAVFRANFNANLGTGNGSGVLLAGAAAVLTGGTNSGELFKAIVDVKSIDGPKRERQFLDGTNLGSPGGYEEMIPHFNSSGEIGMTLQWIPEDTSTHQRLETLQESAALANWFIGFPGIGGSIIRYDAFQAYVKNFSPKADSGSILTADCTLQRSGPISINVVAPNLAP
jgi:hypothetical protein